LTPSSLSTLYTPRGLTEGLVGVARDDGAEELFSKKLACVKCGISCPEIQPRMFSLQYSDV
jgi:excinuclease UvrABC ATPase subunit